MNPMNFPNITESQVKANYLAVMERVRISAEQSFRNPADIKIIGVTKYVDSKMARWLVDSGCRDLGESRPQILWEKATDLSDLDVRWHLIGHLQRNKAKRTLPLLSAMHSLDSERILQQIQADVSERCPPLQLLLEINVSGDADKTGLSVQEGERLLDTWKQSALSHPNIEIVGLMGMGALDGGLDRARKDFEALRLLRDQWSKRFGMPLTELSMGMSEDFEAAIAEGATMVRLGSVLFA